MCNENIVWIPWYPLWIYISHPALPRTKRRMEIHSLFELRKVCGRVCLSASAMFSICARHLHIHQPWASTRHGRLVQPDDVTTQLLINCRMKTRRRWAFRVSADRHKDTRGTRWKEITKIPYCAGLPSMGGEPLVRTIPCDSSNAFRAMGRATRRGVIYPFRDVRSPTVRVTLCHSDSQFFFPYRKSLI